MAKHPRNSPVRREPRARPTGPRRPTPKREPAAPENDAGGWLAGLAGFVAVAALGGAFFAWSGCKHEPPPGATPTSAPPPPPVAAMRPRVSDAGADAAALAAVLDPNKPYDGPLIGSMVSQAPIYVGMEAWRDKRIGYIRHGGKAPVDPTPIKSANCEAGWYRLLAGGYVCGKFATLDLNNPQVRLGTTPPNLDDVLPYRYAWNMTNGTPLYKSVPSREDMVQYEPYLKAKQRADSEPDPASVDNPYAPDGGAVDEKKPWWQQQSIDGGKPEIRLSDLTEDSDALVAKRMVKGFYVAIDRQFPWNNRVWYKTTSALVAPADRFVLNKPPMFKGIDLRSADAAGGPQAAPSNTIAPDAGAEAAVGAGFILSTKATKYQVDPDKQKIVALGPVERFTAARLTGRTLKVATNVYRETAEGWWMRSGDGTYTDPGPPPQGLLAGEKWIDVNLTRQTLIAFEGDRPVYATMISSGKKAKDPNDKVHDHQTIQGSFRIREKHISTTMDGDGPAPGDMPYSIEDVPYVMYFEGSYALHGAFWHNNFGHEQSHGCVNLAPLDAKQLFFWTDPPLPQGWHGVIALKEKQGTRVVVHESSERP
jgi:lipoprotein-anchoring transpeptidase ErfK/SrfK